MEKQRCDQRDDDNSNERGIASDFNTFVPKKSRFAFCYLVSDVNRAGNYEDAIRFCQTYEHHQYARPS